MGVIPKEGASHLELLREVREGAEAGEDVERHAHVEPTLIGAVACLSTATRHALFGVEGLGTKDGGWGMGDGKWSTVVAVARVLVAGVPGEPGVASSRRIKVRPTAENIRPIASASSDRTCVGCFGV